MEDCLPEASIVVPCYRAEATLDRCLTSLLQQRASFPFEIVVVDNNPPDGIPEIVRERASSSRGRLRVISEPRRGAAAARNLGLREARGGLVAFTDADCRADPQWLARLAGALREPRRLLVGGEIKGEPEQRNLLARYACSKSFLSQSHTLRDARGPFFQTANLAVRRAEALAIGGFDPDLHVAGEDADFCWRLRRYRPEGELLFLREAIVFHQHRETLGALFRQFRTYGWADIALSLRHPVAWPYQAGKLATDLLRLLGFPLLTLLAVPVAVWRRDAVPFASPFLRVVQLSGRRAGQFSAWTSGAGRPQS